jgi:hypothetical protein
VNSRDNGIWRALSEEMTRWREAGLTAQFWWRDDDAVADTPQLAALLDLAQATHVPLALAVVPGRLQPSLLPALENAELVTILTHGWQHQNHAGAEEKKSEFGGHRPVYELLAEVAMARTRLGDAFGTRARPVFVPPWNRIDERLVDLLPMAGISALSRYGPRRQVRPAADVVEVNCHVDPVGWRVGGGFLGFEASLRPMLSLLQAQRQGQKDRTEAIGLLTHHLVMDTDTWSFATRLIELLSESEAADWRSVDEITRV